MNNIAGFATVNTSIGNIAYWDSRGEGPAVLLLHGNSATSEVWQKQFTPELARRYRIVAPDLPGHGRSAHPLDKEGTYTYEGYASIVLEVLLALRLHKPVLVGWSLGAHIIFALANDMIKKKIPFAGLLITGSAPVPFTSDGKMDMEQAFNQRPERIVLLKKEQFTPAEAHDFVKTSGFNPEIDKFMLAAAESTDGKARSLIIRNRENRKGCCDSKRLVETMDITVCIILGKHDPLIKLSYLQALALKRFFEGKFHLIDDAGHAAFWDQPERFNEIFARFLAYVTRPEHTEVPAAAL